MPSTSGGRAYASAPLAAPPRRILFTETTTGGVVGGSLTGVLELLEHLDRDRFEPIVVLFEPKPIIADLEAQGIPVHVVPALRQGMPAIRGPRPLRALARLQEMGRVIAPRVRYFVQLFRRERPDLVYCSNGVDPSLTVVTAAALCGIPVICHFKGFKHAGPPARFMSRWVDAAICMTDEIGEYARDEQHIRARQFITIFDGIDATACAPGAGAAVRREFGIPPDAPLVGIVGHIQEWKGQVVAVEAVARARRHIPDLRCLVVGGVHRRGVEYAERLRARVSAPDLAGHVILTGARRDVLACMDAVDVVLHTSDREPFGRVLIEAMAAGRPVIAPREGGPLVIVVDGETGLLVPPRDPDALAAAIVELLVDPARRAVMGRAGRARVEKVFGIRDHVRAVEAVIDEILSARGGGGAEEGRVRTRA